MSGSFFTFAAFAFLLEAVVENVNWVVQNVKKTGTGWNWQRLIALVMSIGLCVSFQIDLFKLVGFETAVPYLGSAMTGILLARGANAFSDLLAKVKQQGG
jgi:hypothetical protein